MTPVLDQAARAGARRARNAFTIVSGRAPAFSGVNGQIDHTGGTLTKAGTTIDEAGALRVAAIWIAVTLLADEISSLAGGIVRRGDVTRERIRPPALRALWGDPNSDQTRMGVTATEVMSLMLWGVSYQALGWTRAGELDVRWPIDPSIVTLDRLPDQGIALKAKGQGELLNRHKQRPEFMMVPLYTLPGRLEPVSPVRAAAELAGLSQAYQQVAAGLVGRGLNPSAVLTFGELVPADIAKQYGARLERLHGGSASAGGVAVVGGKDARLERLGMSMADAQVVELFGVVFDMLLAMWRVPATVAGMVDKPSTWGTGIAEFSRGLERFRLRDLAQRLQAGYEKYILAWAPLPAPEDLQYRFRFDSLLSASPKERVEIQRARMMIGTTSQERVLAEDDEPPFGDDETVFTQLALATEEDRRLQQLRQRAETYGALVRAGMTPAAAAVATGFDPAELEHTGEAPVTTRPPEEQQPAMPPPEDEA